MHADRGNVEQKVCLFKREREGTIMVFFRYHGLCSVEGPAMDPYVCKPVPNVGLPILNLVSLN